MINLEDYSLFKNNTNTLKELSKDDSDPQGIQYMTSSDVLAVDFDKVKDIYQSNLGLFGEHAKSVDAISHTHDAIVFIEFKNGDMKREKPGVRQKISDSLLIFTDVSEKTISYTRENADFVLVYNEFKNPLPNQITKGIPQQSSSRTFITKKIAQLARQEIILFDMERYKGLYFRKVHTYSQEEFDEYASSLVNIK